MHYRFALCVACFLSIISSGQQPDKMIDSFESILKKNPDADSVRVNLLIMKGSVATYTNPREAMLFTDDALNLSRKINWLPGIAAALRQKGSIYQVTGDYIRSIELGQQALKAAEPLHNKKFNASVYLNFGIIQLQIGEYDKALVNFQQSRSLFRDLGFPMEESIALLNIGTTYLRKEVIDSAKEYFTLCLSIAESDGFWQVAGYALSNLGEVYNRKKEYDSAIVYFKKSIPFSEKANDLNIKGQSLAGISETYIKMKQYNVAEPYAQESLNIAIKVGAVQYQKENYQMLADIYKEQGKFEKSLTAYKNFIVARDSMTNEENKSEIVKKEMLFEQGKKEAILNAQHAAEIKQQETTRNFLLGGAGVILIASGLLFFSYKRRRDAIAKKNDAELKTQITDTEMKVMRLQMNPHFIFNSLNSISDYIAKNNSKEADDYLSKFAKVMRMTLENSERQAIPLSDDLKALDLYMQLEAKRLNSKFTYEIKVAEEIDKENTLVPPMIFQPFVENSIWHGIAKKEGMGHIIIDIRKEGKMLHCKIDDDGVGRAKASLIKDVEKQSLGMKITKARIDILNKLKDAASHRSTGR